MIGQRGEKASRRKLNAQVTQVVQDEDALVTRPQHRSEKEEKRPAEESTGSLAIRHGSKFGINNQIRLWHFLENHQDESNGGRGSRNGARRNQAAQEVGATLCPVNEGSNGEEEDEQGRCPDGMSMLNVHHGRDSQRGRKIERRSWECGIRMKGRQPAQNQTGKLQGDEDQRHALWRERTAVSCCVLCCASKERKEGWRASLSRRTIFAHSSLLQRIRALPQQ